jgi:hypothetical protein
MISRHKVFISYHHDNNKPHDYFNKRDLEYREKFESIFAHSFETIISKSVQDGDIPSYSSSDNTHTIIRDEYLRDSTVTVVLIGQDTWKRKHVDWEISSSLRQTNYNSRSGLLGILLPSYEKPNSFFMHESNNHRIEGGFGFCDKKTIPQRLAMNLDNGFAKIYDWSENPYEVQQWIHEAFQRRSKIIPDNSLKMYNDNKYGRSW